MKELIGKYMKVVDLDKGQVNPNDPNDLERKVLIVNVLEAQNAAGVFVQTENSAKNNSGFWIGISTAYKYV